MRKEEWLRRKWREDKDKSHLEKYVHLSVEKIKKDLFNFLFVLISSLSGDLFN